MDQAKGMVRLARHPCSKDVFGELLVALIDLQRKGRFEVSLANIPQTSKKSILPMAKFHQKRSSMFSEDYAATRNR